MFRSFSLALGLCCALCSGSASAASPEESVVRVFATPRLPNPLRPWGRQNPVEVAGTGVIIEGNRILTNSHLVTYASEVFIQPREGGDRVEAKLEANGVKVDLALLSIEDEAFFAERPALKRSAEWPAVRSDTVVYGYPQGGTAIAITKGVVSRIGSGEIGNVTQGVQLQVDATINPGSSGGPALVDGRMAGLIFGQQDNVAFVIPCSEIDLLLDDIKDGRYDGKPEFQDGFQSLENGALRERLKLERSVRGVLVCRAAAAAVQSALREFDVITHIGDQPIDNEGMVKVRDDVSLPFHYLVTKFAKDGKLPITVVREGKSHALEQPMIVGNRELMPSIEGRQPRYFVCGPLVFSPATLETGSVCLRANPTLSLRRSPLVTRTGQDQAFPGEELVLVSSRLPPHRITRGYNEPLGQVVSEVDGAAVKNLRHRVELIRDARGESLTIRFHEQPSELLVFKRKELLATTESLMADNGIPKRGSTDAMEVWESGGKSK